MDKAKQAVNNFMSGDGHHKTTVTQDASQAVTTEQVRPHQHENVTTAVDKEVHQDHHHTTVQPIQHKETLPEKHHHNMVPTEHKTFHHGNESETRDTLDREAAKFKNTSTTHETTHSNTTAPVVTGERVHHHVHEHIQPVIQKETIQPHVVHTTVPIHETHHAKPIHHGTTTLPTKTLEEFNSAKHKLTGNNKLTEFDGCPDKYDKHYEDSEHGGLGSHHHKHHGDHHGHQHGNKAAVAGGGAAAAGAAVVAHKHHNDEKRDGHTSGTLHDRGVDGHEGHHGSHNKTTTAAGAAAAGGAAAAAHKHHNNTPGTNNTTLPSRGVGGQGLENKTGSDSVTAAQTANARANGTTRDNIAHSHTTGKNGGTNTVQSIMHGTHTTTGDSNKYTTSPENGSGLDGGSSLNKAEPRFGSTAGSAGADKHHDDTTDATGKKVSLVDKLNPFKDADGDGHRGIMS